MTRISPLTMKGAVTFEAMETCCLMQTDVINGTDSRSSLLRSNTFAVLRNAPSGKGFLNNRFTSSLSRCAHHMIILLPRRRLAGDEANSMEEKASFRLRGWGIRPDVSERDHQSHLTSAMPDSESNVRSDRHRSIQVEFRSIRMIDLRAAYPVEACFNVSCLSMVV